MLNSVLSFTPELAERASRYCTDLSEPLPLSLQEVWKHTMENHFTADMMSSQLQAAWMIWTAQDRRPKRILEIGTFTGFSALAWYEGSRATKAEIVTLEVHPLMVDAARQMFDKYAVNDRIKCIEGKATDTLEPLTGTFDIIFMDADKKNFINYLSRILDKKLLAPGGVMYVDNVLGRGFTLGKDGNPHVTETTRCFWEKAGAELQKFNKFVQEDSRVDVCLLPLFDGISQIKWRTTEDPEN